MKSKIQEQLEKAYQQVQETYGDRGQFAFHAARRAQHGNDQETSPDQSELMGLCPVCGSLKKLEGSCSSDGFPLDFVNNPKSGSNAAALRKWMASSASDPKIVKLMSRAQYVK